MANIEEIKLLFESLTGKKSTSPISEDLSKHIFFEAEKGICYSQFNEILLLLGFNRVSHSFFQFLVDGSLDFKVGSTIPSLTTFKDGVGNFQRLALLYFGSIKNAFKVLSRDNSKLKIYLSSTLNNDLDAFRLRNGPILKIEEIPSEKTYYLGHLIQNEIDTKFKLNPFDENIIKQKNDINEVTKIGKKNFEAYLASDHLDIYVATSMRLRHEYVYVNRVANNIFLDKELSDLNLRWFNPTQAFCENRIDKGLSEALMLKRAKCTIYLAQESDTLGKDSELATTLAQGKPVIAFVPEIDDKYLDELISDIKLVEPSRNEADILLDILKLVNSNILWDDNKGEKVRNWLNNRSLIDLAELKNTVEDNLKNHYNNRANMLQHYHPLGIQVNLVTGVANGLLVVRNIPDCIRLIKRILGSELKFDLEFKFEGDKKYIHLIENISKCTYRIISGDELLTNSFWNFYLETNADELVNSKAIKLNN